MQRNKFSISLIVAALFFSSFAASAQEGSFFDNFALKGYIKEMPGVSLNENFSNPQPDNLIHFRTNFSWNMGENLEFVAEGRHRVFYNEMFSDYPLLANMFEDDSGLADMSRVWMENGEWLGHSMIDRLYLDYRLNNWHVRVGRQRVNWGINLVSNPNDLFNTYSFFDFDYAERPGADAIRVQYYTGFASRIDLAYSPARSARESVGALLWSTNYKGYDFQALAGYYMNRSAIGGGWAGSIGGAGFKGEFTWFQDIEKNQNQRDGNVVAAAGLDYMFPDGTFAILEFLYNGGFQPLQNAFLMLDQPLSPDNIMFSEYAVTLSTQHSFSPLFSGGVAVMLLPDQEAFYISPSFTYSLLTNWDMAFISQIFTGGESTIFNEAGSAFYISLKYSF